MLGHDRTPTPERVDQGDPVLQRTRPVGSWRVEAANHRDRTTLLNNRRTAIAMIPAVLLGLWLASTVARPALHADLSPADIAAAQCKLAMLRGRPGCGPASTRSAALTYVPTHFEVTLTDKDLTVLANERAQEMYVPVSNLIIHAAGNNTIQGTGNAQIAGQNFDFLFEAVVDSPTVRPTVRVTDIQFGGVPDFVSKQLAANIGKTIYLGSEFNLSSPQVQVGVGQVTVSGYR
jgi:hypothetical protein